MVVAMQELTSLSVSDTTSTKLEERIDASLVYTSSAEPLNAAPVKAVDRSIDHFKCY